MQIGNCFPNLPGPLEVNLQQHGFSGSHSCLHGAAQGAVAVDAVHDGPLQQFALLNEQVEIVGRFEEVVDSLHLARARLAGGC